MKYRIYPSKEAVLNHMRARRDACLDDLNVARTKLDDYRPGHPDTLYRTKLDDYRPGHTDPLYGDDLPLLEQAVDGHMAEAARYEDIINLMESHFPSEIAVEIED